MPQPNLVRIPAGGDALAVQTLRRAPEVVDGLFLRTVDKQAQLALGRYGARAPSLALREQDPSRLREGLLASALHAAVSGDDPRDVMGGLALHYDCAERLGEVPAVLFSEVAIRVADPATADLLRVFGARDDVTLRAFGWQLVDGPDGQDFEPTNP